MLVNLDRTLRPLADLGKTFLREYWWLGYRAVRLLVTNPRVFLTRLSMVAELSIRRPIATAHMLAAAHRRREEIDRSYQAWLASQGDALAAPRSCRELIPWPAASAMPAAAAESEPILSVIMPVHNSDQRLLEEAIQSVMRQTHARWELCIADDASATPSLRPFLERYAAADSRIRVTFRDRHGHISAAANSAIALASGEFIVLLDHDDLLSPDALARIAGVIREEPEVDFIYSDEDKIDQDGNRSQPFFKPAWSPTLLTSCNYITHLAAIRRSLVVDLGGFRDDMVGSQDHDLFLRVAEHARAVAHIPCVLYSWRMTGVSTAGGPSAKPYAVDAARRALQDTIKRRALAAEVEETHLSGIFVLRRRLRLPVPVSLIVLGDDTRWRDVLRMDEIDVRDVAFIGRPQTVDGRITVASEIDALSQDYLVWLDASSKPRSAESVTAMLEHLQDERVALVGGTSRRPEGTVLQAGMAIAADGQPVYSYAGLSMFPQPNFYLNLKDLPRETAAVYVGCCAMRRDTWRHLGGWNVNLPPVLAMSDLCLQALEAGYRHVYSPLALFERERPLPPIPSVERLEWRWQCFEDPFWSPNMNPASPDGLPFQSHMHSRARILRCQHGIWPVFSGRE